MKTNLRSGTSRQRTIRALVVAHVIAGIGVSQIDPTSGPSSLVMIYLATVISQSALIGLWLQGMGQTPLIRRGTLVLVGLLAIVALRFVAELRQGKVDYYANVIFLAMICVIEAMTQALTSQVLRRTGWQIGVESECATSAGAFARMQFSLFDMFLFTTIVALILGALAGMRQLMSFFEILEYIDSLALLGAASTVITFSVTWVALSRRSFRWRLMALPIALVVDVAAYFIQRNWYLSQVLALHAVITIVALFVLRIAGYRLFVSNRHNSVEPANAGAEA